ncbi:MAG: Acetylornithine deacetylase [Verrucomicrobiales bacterium]|nr:Acetylornithine deacetylase [Verrucomicrobiales bacterium]
MSPVHHLCRELIAIPSVNPDGDPGTPHTGEKACAEFVGGFLSALGAEVSYEEILPSRPNVIGRFPSNPAPAGLRKPRILLAPHTDTVSVAGMTIDPFGGDVRDGRLYGRGACDTKGTMAAMLTALQQIGPRIPDLEAEIVFVGFMGEETGQWGSRDYAAKYAGAHDFALIGEPTDCAVVHTHKGSYWCSLTTTGRAAHGARPELGENAILKMQPVIAALYQDFIPRLQAPEFHHPVLGDSTLNLGTIHGGTRSNIVPDSCTIRLDIRFTPAVHRRGIAAMLQEFLDEKGLPVTVVRDKDAICAPLDTPAQNPFVQQLAACGNGTTGAPWFCDAAWLAAAGLPAVAAGPGSIAQAHTADEWITLEALDEGVVFYRKFLEQIRSFTNG